MADQETVIITSPAAEPQGVELLPCPFCGAVFELATREGQPAFWITHLSECYIASCKGNRHQWILVRGVKKWNTRADLPRATAEEVPARLTQIQERYSNTADSSAIYRVSANDLGWLINEVELRTRATGETTVEACLAELRELLPRYHFRITFCYDSNVDLDDHRYCNVAWIDPESGEDQPPPAPKGKERSSMVDLSRYEQRGKDWFCKKDGTLILAVIRYYPVWDGPFPCSGSGEVLSENIPFCPTCEESPTNIGTPVTSAQ